MEDFIKPAIELIQRREFEAAAKLLEESLRAMPAGWRPVQDFPFKQHVACWDYLEFLCLVGHQKQVGSNKGLVWILPSYSYGYYLLGHVRVDLGQAREALQALDHGLELEPDHPQVLCEKAFIFQKLRRPEVALDLYRNAAMARPTWTPNPVRARVLRGLGVTLVDFGKLDEAETYLKESLSLDPNNSLALEELDLIAALRKKARTTRPSCEAAN